MIKPKVLIIDDDRIFARLLQMTLCGYDTKLAHDVIVGMDLVDSFKPDAIVLDLLMPAANGLSLINELVSYVDTAAIPIIICSAAAADLNPEPLIQAGVIKIFDKTNMQPDDIGCQLKAYFDGR